MRQRLQKLPKIDKLLETESLQPMIARYGKAMASDLCRDIVADARKRVMSEPDLEVEDIVAEAFSKALSHQRLAPLQKVINATGVILHTNLGRAPLGDSLFDEIRDEISGACGLEIDLGNGKRGVRGDFARAMAAKLCHAEDALIVNNNAAALLLILSALAKDKDVIVSRGELVQIGGGFRIPDVIVQGGARLKEVGTTNITTLADYENAIDENTGAILKVHLSNFHMGGFTKRPSTKALASIKARGLPFIEDLGSGNFVSRIGDMEIQEKTPARVIQNGADIVSFSGDKLLGGVQAGIIAGRKDFIDTLARFPLMRAIRPCKFTYAALQTVFARYLTGKEETLSPWRQIKRTRAEIKAEAKRFLSETGLDEKAFPIIDTIGEFGAGSMPGEAIESAAVVIAEKEADKVFEAFRRQTPSVMGLIRDDRFLLDFLTIEEHDHKTLASVARAVLFG